MFYKKLRSKLERLKNLKKARVFAGFFKTGKGEYGQGEIFWGIYAWQIDKTIKPFLKIAGLKEVERFLTDSVHEVRLAGLKILVKKYQKGSQKEKEEIVQFYLKNLSKINNWDLVDLSAPKILGDFLFSKEKGILEELASSENFWQRRIAIVSTYGFIRKGHFEETIRLAEKLLSDREDLIAKAIGWMLREVGKRDEKILRNFLQKNSQKMQRVTLRYAIERFSEKERKRWLEKKYKKH